MTAKAVYRQELQALPRCFTRVCGSSEPHDPPPQEQLDEFVSSLRDRTDLKLDYLADGCFARSQLIAHELREQGLQGSKIFAQSLLTPLRASDEDEQVAWSYHVAVIMLARVGDEVQPRVLDPQTADHTLSIREWLSHFRDRQRLIVTVHEDTKYQNGVFGSRDFAKNVERARKALREL